MYSLDDPLKIDGGLSVVMSAAPESAQVVFDAHVPLVQNARAS